MDELLAAMSALRAAVDDVVASASGLKDLGEPPDFEDLVVTFAEVTDLVADLRDAKADVGEAAHHALPARAVRVRGVGDVERTWGYDRSEWQHDDLLARSLAWARDERQIFDEETGEYESDGMALVRVLRDLVGISYWKLGKKGEGTGLRGRGLDPDEFCKTTPKRKSITIPGAAKRALAADRAAGASVGSATDTDGPSELSSV